MILREAARAFTENGVQNTSIDDVAARLGVTKPALYHYVSSKDELILQCLQTGMEELGGLMKEAQALNGNGLDKLRFLFRRWAEFAVTDFGRAIELIEAHSLEEDSREEYLAVHRSLLHHIEDFVSEGISDGSIRACTPAVTALALVGVFTSPARWYRPEGPLILDRVIDELIGLMEKGIADTPR